MGNKSSSRKNRHNAHDDGFPSSDEHEYNAGDGDDTEVAPQIHHAYSDPATLHESSPQFPSVVATVMQKRKEKKKTPSALSGSATKHKSNGSNGPPSSPNTNKIIVGSSSVDFSSPGGDTPPLPNEMLEDKASPYPDDMDPQVVLDEYGSPRGSIFATDELENPEIVMASRFTMFEMPPDAQNAMVEDSRLRRGLSKMMTKTTRMLETIRNQKSLSTKPSPSLSEYGENGEHDPQTPQLPMPLDRIKSTLSTQDLKETLTAVSYAVYYHLVAGEKSHIKTFVSELSEIQNPTPDPVQGPPATRRPSPRNIADYLEFMFKKAQLSAETAVVVVVYVERLMAIAGVTLDRTNWRRCCLICTLLAAKAWEDEAVWNVDFVQLFPGLNVKDVNKMEMKMLELLQYSITVKASQYARYYFELRHLMETRDYKFTVSQVSQTRLAELEKKSSRVQRLRMEESYKELSDKRITETKAMANVGGESSEGSESVQQQSGDSVVGAGVADVSDSESVDDSAQVEYVI